MQNARRAIDSGVSQMDLRISAQREGLIRRAFGHGTLGPAWERA